ncbi:MAG: 2-oxoacid:acceptor oxidoreductase subunit alpha [Deltaproteobacteria bacterium]|nr:2-oxoacid:acceptor oxidoreductase subunit alpha [Deltaproteobacteria bacterium]
MTEQRETRRIRFIQGNEACAEGALYAGCRFFAGYPITPSSEIAEVLGEKLPRLGGRFIQMEDEIAAMAAVIGASLAGVKSLTATSGPGFSLKQENIGYACITEVPCVIVNVQRGGPSTGLPTGPAQADILQTRWGTHGDHPIIVVTPSTVAEMFTETVRAFNLSEKFRTPVVVLADEIVGHMREKLVVPATGEIEILGRAKPACDPSEYRPYDVSRGDVPPMANFGEGYRFHVTGLSHDATGFPTSDAATVHADQVRMTRKIYGRLEEIEKSEETETGDAEILLVAIGSTARSARSAVRLARERGLRAGLFRPITLWPFPDARVRDLAKKALAVVVPEMNLGQLALEVERVAHCDVPITGVHSAGGEAISPAQILAAVEKAVVR